MSKLGFGDVFDTESIEERKKELEESRKKGGNITPYLNIRKDEIVKVAFLQNKPLTFYQHRVYDPELNKYRNLTCIRQNCPLCKVGDKPRYVGAYLVYHLDNVEEVNGKEKVVPKVKIFLKGINTLVVLDKKNKRKPLTSEYIEIERIGEGFDTQYVFEFTGEKVNKNKLPEELPDLKEIFAPQVDVLKKLALEKSADLEEDEEDEELEEIERNELESDEDDEEIPF